MYENKSIDLTKPSNLTQLPPKALGAHPLLFGQFPASSSSAARPVTLHASLPTRTAILPAARVQLRPILTPQQQGANGNKKFSAAQHKQPQQHVHFWAARLKDVLLGQAVFLGLTLVFESFGARVTFEVRRVHVSTVVVHARRCNTIWEIAYHMSHFNRCMRWLHMARASMSRTRRRMGA